MRAFTADELTRMRAVQVDAMMDTCTLCVWSPTVDDYGTQVPGYTDTTNVACGWDVTGGIAAREAARQNGTITTIVGALRLSLTDGAGLTEKDRVTITHRNGEVLTPAQTFGIDGLPMRGPTGYTLRLAEAR